MGCDVILEDTCRCGRWRMHGLLSRGPHLGLCASSKEQLRDRVLLSYPVENGARQS
jgi:hypothetical protein